MRFMEWFPQAGLCLLWRICDFTVEGKEMINEIDNPEFPSSAIKSFSELFSSITSVNLNISIHRNLKDEMWFVVEKI